MNINELKEIVENAPEGANHFDGVDYYYAHFVASPDHCIWNVFDKGNGRFTVVGDMYLDECMKMRSLEDIRTIIELYEGLQNAVEACYDLDSFGVRETNSDYINAYKLLERFE